MKAVFSKSRFLLILTPLLWGGLTSNSQARMRDPSQFPFYLGISGGYGTTTWNQLVSRNQTAAMVLATPIRADEGGATWGIFGGYEFNPSFALEASFLRYPTAKIYFDPMSLFAFDHGSTVLSTKTETLSLSGKFMVRLPHTAIRAYSSAGAAGIHRDDYVTKAWILGASFGVGFNYNINTHLMGEIGSTYTTGSGQSELDPAEHYLPFTYAIFARLAYRL
jgi:hypothetical protein